jgi:putative ABC transport system permease protein
MFRFFPYMLKSLWRHRTRSMLTASGAAVGLFVFCFVSAVQEGLDSLARDRQADRSLIVFQENRFCPATSRLPVDYADVIADVDGVDRVVPIQVYTNNCRASLDAIVFHGLPPAELREIRELELLAGDWSGFQARSDAAVVGRTVARRRNVHVGDSFSIGQVTVWVAGIFRSAVLAEENLIYTHLDFLQLRSGLNAVGLATAFEVRLADRANPDTVAAAVDRRLSSGPVATATRRKGAFQASSLADLIDLIRFSHWLGYAAVGLVLSLVATTTVMTVEDRIGEHAVLQTLGFRPTAVFRLVVAESLLLCLAGGLIGTAVALIFLATSGFAVAAEGVTLAFQPSARQAIFATAVSAIVGLSAALLPAFRAATTDVVTALRKA